MSARGSITAAAAGFTAFVNVYALQSLLPMLAEAFQAESRQVSLAVSATTLAVALASPAAGWLVGRMNRGSVTKLSVGGMVFCGLQAAMADSLGALIFWRFAQGLFLPVLIAGVLTFLAEDFPRNLVGRATSNYVAWTVVGGFAGRWMGGFTAEWFGWRAALFALALANAVAGLVLFLSLQDPNRRVAGKQLPEAGDFLRSLRCSHLRSAYVIGFGTLFTMTGTFTYVTFYLAGEPFGLSPAQLGNTFCVYLCGIVVTPLVGRYFSRYGQTKVIGTTVKLAWGGMFLTLLPNLWAVVGGLAFICVAGFATQASVSSYIALLSPKDKSVAAGLYLSSYYLGGSLGAFLPGVAWELGGWTACVGLLAVIQVVVNRASRRLD